MSTQTSPRLSSPLRDLISIRELERKFRRTRRSILRWVATGLLPPPTKCVSDYWWDREVLAAWFANRDRGAQGSN